MGNLLYGFRSQFVAVEATFWGEEQKGNCLFLVSKICSKDRLLLFFWKSLIGQIPPRSQPKGLYPSPSPTSKLKLAKNRWRKTCWVPSFHTMVHSGGGAVCNGNLHNHQKQRVGSQSGNCTRNGIVKEAQVRGHPSLTLNDQNISIFLCKAL